MDPKLISETAKSVASAMPVNDAKKANLFLDAFAVIVFGLIVIYVDKENYPDFDEYRLVFTMLSFVFMMIITVYCLLTHAKVPTGSSS